MAVVNVEELFARYKRPAALEKQIRERQQEIIKEAEGRRAALEQQRQALQAFKPGTPDYQEKRVALRREEIEFQVWRTLADEEIKQRHKDSFRSIYDDVRRGVAKVAKQKGLQIVLTYDTLAEDAPDSQALRQQILLQKVVYWEPQLDITEEVLKVINDEFDAKQKEGGAAPRGDANTGLDDRRHVRATVERAPSMARTGIRPEGATDRSHVWSEAQPVDLRPPSTLAPEGRRRQTRINDRAVDYPLITASVLRPFGAENSSGVCEPGVALRSTPGYP